MTKNHMRIPRASRVAAFVAVVLAAIAYLWEALWPYAYRGETATTLADVTVIERITHASSIAVNGAWILGLLAVPLTLAVFGFLAATLGQKVAVWLCASMLLGFSMVALASVGLFFMPSAIALLLAAALLHRTPSGLGSSLTRH